MASRNVTSVARLLSRQSTRRCQQICRRQCCWLTLQCRTIHTTVVSARSRGPPPRNRIAAIIFPNFRNPDGSLNHWNMQQSALIITILAFLILQEYKKQVKELTGAEQTEKEASVTRGAETWWKTWNTAILLFAQLHEKKSRKLW